MLAVLVFHCSELTGTVGFGAVGRALEIAGSLGPIIFFVISGFLLYRPYVAASVGGRPVPSVRRYARRRALRILPAYWAVLTLLAIYPGITGVFSSDWWRFYGYLQIYSGRTQGQGLAVAWTLCVEVTFYILLPVWAFVVRRAPIAGRSRMFASELSMLALVALVGLAVQLLVARKLISYQIGLSIAGQAQWLAIGMTFAVVSAHDATSGRALAGIRYLADRPSICWLLAALAYAGLCALVPTGGLFGMILEVRTPQSYHVTLARLLLSAVFVALLVLPAAFGDHHHGVPRAVLKSAPLAGLGLISYSFYLWHLPVAELMSWVSLPNAFSDPGWGLLGHVHVARTFVLFVATLIVTGAVATLSYRFIELPFLRRKELRAPAPRTSVDAALR